MLDRWTLLAYAALALMTCCTLALVGTLRQLRRLPDVLSKAPKQTRPAQGADQGTRALLRDDPAGSRLLGRLARFQSERFAPPMREQK